MYYYPMDDIAQKLELTQEDFLGYDPEELRCTQCKGMICAMRAARVYQGVPFIMCSDKDEVKEVLTALYRKSPVEARAAGQPSA